MWNICDGYKALIQIIFYLDVEHIDDLEFANKYIRMI
jgi:hypothetical protein